MREFEKVSGSGTPMMKSCDGLRLCLRFVCSSLTKIAGRLRLLAPPMVRSYDSLRLWKQGMREFEKVSGSGSRACVILRTPQALTAVHDFEKVSGFGSRACMKLRKSHACLLYTSPSPRD